MACCALLAACSTFQPYRAAPPDLEAHAEAWSARDLAAGSVATYAESLEHLNPDERGPFDLNDGLSMQEAETAALLFNPELRTARLAARVPLLSAQQSGLPPDPELSLDLWRIIESVSQPWFLGGSLQFTIPLSGRLRAERVQAFAEADSARAAAQLAESETLTALRDEWNRWTTTGEHIALSDRYVTQLDGIIKIAQVQRDARQIGEPQLRVLELERVRREGEIVALRGRHRRQELALKKRIGLKPEAPVALIPGLSPTAAEDSPTAERAQLRERNLELAWLHARYLAAEKELATEIRRQYPDLSIGPGGETEQGRGSAGLSGGSKIPLWNRNRQAIAEARAKRDAARGAYEAEYEALVGELASVRAEIEATSAQSAWLRDRVAPLADKHFLEVRRLGELGDMDVLILKDALVSDLETKVQILDVRLEQALAVNRLRALLTPLRTPGDPRCAKGGTR